MAEGPGFNIFAVSGGRVVTPSANVLEGITRRTVFELCEQEKIVCRAGAISSRELANADEIFISSTAGGLMPITQLDARAIGNGVPGPVSSRLYGLYWTRKEQGWHGTPIRYADTQGNSVAGQPNTARGRNKDICGKAIINPNATMIGIAPPN